MKRITSKAISKYKKDGLVELLSTSLPYIKNRFNKWQYRKRILYHRNAVERPLQPIHVDPKKVKYSLLESDQTTYNRRKKNPIPHPVKMEKAGFKKPEYGTILSGDWDMFKMKQNHEIIYRSLRKHLVEGKPFNKTEYGYIKHLQIQLGIETRVDSLDEFYDYKIGSLVDSLKNNGYLSIQEQYDNPTLQDNLNEFGINIGRNGELISNSINHHRLSLSKILNINSIPLIVIVKHSDWQAIRREVRQANSFTELSKKAQDNIQHPDLKKLICFNNGK